MSVPFKCPKCGSELDQCEVDWILCRTCKWSSWYQADE